MCYANTHFIEIQKNIRLSFAKYKWNDYLCSAKTFFLVALASPRYISSGIFYALKCRKTIYITVLYPRMER